MHDLCSICEYEFLFQIMTSYGCFLLALAVDQGIFSIQKQASFFWCILLPLSFIYTEMAHTND